MPLNSTVESATRRQNGQMDGVIRSSILAAACLPTRSRGLEQLDHLLAVGAGRAEVAITPASCGCYLIARPCRHGASPV